MTFSHLFRKFRQLCLIFVWPLIILIVALCLHDQPETMEFIASRVTPFIEWPIRLITNAFSFSLSELALASLPFLLLYAVLYLFLGGFKVAFANLRLLFKADADPNKRAQEVKNQQFGKRCWRLIVTLCCVVSYTLSTVLLFHVYNFHRLSVAAHLNYPERVATVKEVAASARVIVSSLNEITKLNSGSQLKEQLLAEQKEQAVQHDLAAIKAQEQAKAQEQTQESTNSQTQAPESAATTDVDTAASRSAQTESSSAVNPTTSTTQNTIAANETSETQSLKTESAEQQAKETQAFETEPSSTTLATATQPSLKELVEPSEQAQAGDVAKAETAKLVDNFAYLHNLSIKFPERIDDLLAIAVSAYQEAGINYPWLNGQTIRPKPITLSYFWSFTDTAGMYMPPFLEANVNIAQPPAFILFTAAHEMAHQRNFAKEDEANFLAFLTLSNAKNLVANYAAYLNAWIYVGNALYASDQQLFNELYHELPEQVKADLLEHAKFWSQFAEHEVAKQATDLNDQFLKANGESRGILTYDDVTNLIVAHFKAKQLI